MRRIRTFEALRFPRFRRLWLGQMCISMGTWMDSVSRGWLLYELTNSPLQLGLVRAVQAIPYLFLSPIAGTLADRYNRKAQLVTAQVIDALMYGLMTMLIMTGRVEPWHVYTTAILTAVVQVFEQPARQALVSESVDAGHLTNAIGLNSVVFNASRSTGPALAGMLIAGFGTAGSYAAQTTLYLVGTVWTLQLDTSVRDTGGPKRSGPRASFAASILEGWRFAWTNDAVRAGMVVAFIGSLLAQPFSTLLPVFARDVLHVGSSGQGFLLTAMGIGALTSAVFVASFGDQLPRGLLMVGGVTLYGIGLIAFAASPWFPLSFVILLLVGTVHVSSHALVQTVVQAYSPPELRGRSMGTFQQTQVFLTLGSMLAGGLASLWDAPTAVRIMGLACTISAASVYFIMPKVRTIR